MIALASWVELHSILVDEKDDRAYIAPDDTVFNVSLEACVSGEGQMNWRVEHSQANGEKGGTATKINPTCCSQYRHCQRRRRPFSGCEHHLCLQA